MIDDFDLPHLFSAAVRYLHGYSLSATVVNSWIRQSWSPCRWHVPFTPSHHIYIKRLFSFSFLLSLFALYLLSHHVLRPSSRLDVSILETWWENRNITIIMTSSFNALLTDRWRTEGLVICIGHVTVVSRELPPSPPFTKCTKITVTLAWVLPEENIDDYLTWQIDRELQR